VRGNGPGVLRKVSTCPYASNPTDGLGEREIRGGERSIAKILLSDTDDVTIAARVGVSTARLQLSDICERDL
jgi:hypothetical protein